jgi:Tfp pilus assembly protein PilX
MKSRNAPRWKDERGVVLIVAMLVMAALSVLGLAFLMTARTEDAIAVNYRNHTAAFYAAEAGLESGVSSLKSLLGATSTPTDAQLAALAPAPLTDPSYTFDAFQVQRVRTTPPFAYTTTLSGGAYNGLIGQTTDYVVTASVQGPRGSRARLTQKIQFVGIPLFQFGAFYGRGVDLEIFPGPPMNFTGRIHSNSNLYLRSGNGLKIDSYVTTTGNIYRNTKADPSNHGTGAVEIVDASGNYQALNFDHYSDYDFTSPWSAADWSSAALGTFGGRVQDSAMGVQEIVPPIPDAFYDPANADVSSHLMIEKGSAADPAELKDAKLYYEADLIIEGTKAYDQAGNEIKINDCKDSKGKNAVRKESFYDGREKTDMEVTQIDVGALKDCGVMPANGILYANPKDVKKGEGVRLVNGAELPPQGLTVVSESPVYVQGDYNTVNKVPAGVLADAITVLSNNWNKNDYDKKGKDVTSKRPAAETTVNAAFAMGPSHETEPGKENGQLNNLIRFLEDWKDVGFNYKGSLVALWHSQNATEYFRCCGDSGDNYYRPPNRNWGYDPLFNTNPPPGTPMGIIVTRGQWSEG